MTASKNIFNPTDPIPSRPHIPDYGIPTTVEGLLPWSHVIERMEKARNFWIATTSPDTHPHATPVWGVWYQDGFYFDGSPKTQRGRNLAANPAVVVHLESGDDVVILHGEAHPLESPSHELTTPIAAAYSEKYRDSGYSPTPAQWDQGGLYQVRIKIAFAWTKFPQDATRWIFT